MKSEGRLLILAVLVAALWLTAAGRVDLGVAVGTPPPPPPLGVVVGPVGIPPAPGYVWVPGHWDWVGGQWVWVDGRWIMPPRARAVWVDPKIEFRWHRGHWR